MGTLNLPDRAQRDSIQTEKLVPAKSLGLGAELQSAVPRKHASETLRRCALSYSVVWLYFLLLKLN